MKLIYTDNLRQTNSNTNLFGEFSNAFLLNKGPKFLKWLFFWHNVFRYYAIASHSSELTGIWEFRCSWKTCVKCSVFYFHSIRWTTLTTITLFNFISMHFQWIFNMLKLLNIIYPDLFNTPWNCMHFISQSFYPMD